MAEENTTPEIVETTIRDLDPRFIRQLENAEKSIDKNPAYVIDICCTILSKYPSCVEVRKILRQAQFKKYGKGNPIAKFTASIQGMIFSMQAGSKIAKGLALEVMADAEKMLSVCPENEGALKTLASAAEALKYWGTVAEAYQAIAKFKPNDEKTLLALADALVKSKQPDAAMQVCEKILRKNPSNGDAQALARSASVIKTMDKGDWEDTNKSATEKQKDAEEALKRAKETSSVNDEETLARMVERLSAQIQTDPENINLYREICGHLRTLKRFEEALDFVRKARQQPLGKGDTTFEKMEQGFLVAAMDQRIAGLKKKLEENPDDEAVKAELAEVQKQEHDIKLENAKQMVERYPNDFNYRYELGMLLFDD
ncbi:MAG: tetratricopeptide repeat protein, partial [Opitutales bacterium]|nr:tetratricopeptide repeat protein [Opitutales bacterium]